jgi:transcriptional regulator with XRE-family HTH domain
MATEIDIRELAARLKARRGKRGLRVVAAEIGDVSAATLSRVEQGKVPDLDTFIRLCKWLGLSADQLVKNDKPKSKQKAGQPTSAMSTKNLLAAHLRADRTLKPNTAEALVRMIELAYEASERGELNE